MPGVVLAVAAWYGGAAIAQPVKTLSVPTGTVATSAPAAPAVGLIVKLKPAATAPAYGAAAAPLDREQAAQLVATESKQRLEQALSATAIHPQHLHARGGRTHLLDFGRVLSGEEAEQMAEKLRARSDVEWVVPNEREQLLQSATEPNDPLFSSQWWLHVPSGSSQNIVTERRRGLSDFRTAWGLNTGANSAIVAVLDTGITPHPELTGVGRVLSGWDFVSDVPHAGDGNGRDADPADPGDGLTDAEVATTTFKGCMAGTSSWHGTSIAGMLAANTNNSLAEAAISWNGRVLPVRVAGKCGAAVTDIIDGMRWAAGLAVTNTPVNPNPARILTISFGGSAACNAAYQEAIDELARIGVVIVAAAGNEHTGVLRPASCANVVGVAALNRDGFKASYSNFGPQVVISTVGGDPGLGAAWDALADDGLLMLTNAGFRAPGNPTSAYRAGTSFSTPIVAGALSLMLSVNANLTRDQLITGLRRSARPHVTSTQARNCSNDNPGRCVCTTSTCGVGILDANQALIYAANPGTYQEPNRSAVSINSTVLQALAAAGNDRPANAAAPSDNQLGAGALGPGWLLALALAVLLAAPRRVGRGRR